MLDFFRRPRYNGKAKRDGRLAQLVAHPLDVREVTSSSLVSSTTNSSLKSEEFFFSAFLATFASKKLPCFLPPQNSTHILACESAKKVTFYAVLRL